MCDLATATHRKAWSNGFTRTDTLAFANIRLAEAKAERQNKVRTLTMFAELQIVCENQIDEIASRNAGYMPELATPTLMSQADYLKGFVR